ncbi:hypothetical protein DFP92_12037 [Yoonia sediminilitoris]|uniref:Uncharacterized protein n=1 Tax=Yoonia sediminilitoris TaxID=1286148 RepID=A0A2T6K6H7_9RHOB|nr:hypothetical protein C8N45_12037 [Yoonia sediminilitoris]RCW89783.1 hypothetical protein DFP92_12037 [Yoonia sediminilitoris]
MIGHFDPQWTQKTIISFHVNLGSDRPNSRAVIFGNAPIAKLALEIGL